MTSTKKDIRALSEAQIIDILKEKGEAKFRAKQIYEWLI
jgi:23S rRNA (adenine2503-C2)-methyltransferase